MTAQLSPSPIFRAWDPNGLPLSYGKLYSYAAGTTTKIATYIDSTEDTPNTNPVILSAFGTCALWLDPTLTYKFVLTDSVGNTMPGYPVDNIPGGFGAGGFSGNLIPNPTNTYTLGSPTNSWAQLYLGPSEAPVFDLASGNVGYYAKTAAEIAAGVTPVNYAYAPGDVRRYGADPTTTIDSTAALQAAINQQFHGGPSVYLPNGAYKVGSAHSGTTPVLTGYPGTKITGEGCPSQAGAAAPIGGSSINYIGSGAAPVLSITGTSVGNYDQAPVLRDFSVYNQGGALNATGIQLLYAPFSLLENLFISSFAGNTQAGTNGGGIEQGLSSWGCTFLRVNMINCSTCLNAHDAGEDSVYINCSWRSYDYTRGVSAYFGDQAQTVTFIECDLSENQYGILLNQGDTNGNGTGIPLPMQLNVIGCQFENMVHAAIAVVTSNQSAAIKYYPSIVAINNRAFVSGSSVPPANNGQAFIYAQVCSQIKVTGLNESGYSYGAILGCSSYGYTFSGSAKPGPVIFELDTAYTYGTARIATAVNVAGAYPGSASILPGDHAIARLTSSALSYVSGNFTRIPFGTVVSDPLSWYQTSVLGIQPSKNQTIRFKTQVVTQSAPAGNYSLLLYKSGSSFLQIASITVSTAGSPLVLSGEGYDEPSGPGYGSGDYYWVVVFGGGNFTLDTANSYFLAEVSGL